MDSETDTVPGNGRAQQVTLQRRMVDVEHGCSYQRPRRRTSLRRLLYLSERSDGRQFRVARSFSLFVLL